MTTKTPFIKTDSAHWDHSSKKLVESLRNESSNHAQDDFSDSHETWKVYSKAREVFGQESQRRENFSWRAMAVKERKRAEAVASTSSLLSMPSSITGAEDACAALASHAIFEKRNYTGDFLLNFDF